MIALSEDVFAALVRATLLVAVAAALVFVVLRISRIRSPGVWRAASLAVLVVGWASLAGHSREVDLVNLLISAADGKLATSPVGGEPTKEDVELRLWSLKLLGRLLQSSESLGRIEAGQWAVDAQLRARNDPNQAVRLEAIGAWPANILLPEPATTAPQKDR